MIDINDYLIVQKPLDNSYYKIRINSLDNLFVGVGKTPGDLFDKIYELSSYILELSAEITSNYLSKQQLLDIFETKSATDKMILDEKVMNEEEIESYIKENRFVTLETTETKYYANTDNTYKVFDAVDSAMEKWI